MGYIDLKKIPTSEIVFYLMHHNLDKGSVNDVLTKRLASYGLSYDEIVDLLVREIIKVKSRGNDLDSYCFRQNKSVEDLLRIGFSAVSRTDNFGNLTVSEVVVLKDVINQIRKHYQKFIELSIRNGVDSKTSIFSRANSVNEYFELSYKILCDLLDKEYGYNALSQKVRTLRELLIMNSNATKFYFESLFGREKLDYAIISDDEKLIRTYGPVLK